MVRCGFFILILLPLVLLVPGVFAADYNFYRCSDNSSLGTSYNITFTSAGSDTSVCVNSSGVSSTNLAVNVSGYIVGKIQLQNNETDNLEDSYVSENVPNTNYGISTDLLTDSINVDERQIYLKFSLNKIPINTEILNATLHLYKYKGASISYTSRPESIYNSSNLTWNENVITWNNRPGSGALIDTVTTYRDTNGWINWTVTSAINYSYETGESNITLIIIAGGAGPNTKINWYYSKESSNITLRPYLNVTYKSLLTPTNLSLDLSNNSVIDWNMTGELNSTNSPQWTSGIAPGAFTPGGMIVLNWTLVTGTTLGLTGINWGPWITSATPVNDYTSTSTSVIINVTATDPDNATLNYYFYWNGTFIETNTNGSFNFTPADIEQLNNWTVNVSDEISANVTTSTRNITTDYTIITLYGLKTGLLITENMTITLKTGNFSTIQSLSGNNVTFKNLNIYVGTMIIPGATNISSSYFQVQIISDTFTAGEDFDLYLVKNTDDYALNTLKLQDLVGTFKNAQFQAWAYVGLEFVQVFEDIFDIEDKVSAYFDRDTRYTIYVKNNVETRGVGDFKPGIHGDSKIVTIGIVSFNPEAERMDDFITYGWTTTNDTITFSWIDLLDETTSVEFWVYNNTNYSQEVYTALCTNSTVCSFSYTVLDITKTYTSHFQANGTRWGHSPYEQSKDHALSLDVLRIDLGLPADKELWYWGFSVSMIIISAMLFTRKHAPVGGILSMSLGLFFVYVGWLPSAFAKLFVVLLIIALIHAIRRREK